MGTRGPKGVKKWSKRGPRGVWGPPRPQKWHFLKKSKKVDFWTPSEIITFQLLACILHGGAQMGVKKVTKKGSKNGPNPITPLQGVPGKKPS